MLAPSRLALRGVIGRGNPAQRSSMTRLGVYAWQPHAACMQHTSMVYCNFSQSSGLEEPDVPAAQVISALDSQFPLTTRGIKFQTNLLRKQVIECVCCHVLCLVC